MGRRGNGDHRPRAQVNGALPQVFLVRHGGTAWTISRQHTGRTDNPLTDRGEREARALSVAERHDVQQSAHQSAATGAAAW